MQKNNIKNLQVKYIKLNTYIHQAHNIAAEINSIKSKNGNIYP